MDAVDARIASGERYCGACLEWARDCACSTPVHVVPCDAHRRRAARGQLALALVGAGGKEGGK